MAKGTLESAAPLIPPRPTLPKLRAAAAACRACDLWRRGTQTVFGEGGRSARLVLVGEQPGDREDLEGRPFVGPSGQLLDDALEEAGIDRRVAYVTNAVKHFKWEPRGKKRIHQKPNAVEIAACRPWLDAELAVLRPDVLVCLGATAAQALLGRTFRVTKPGRAHSVSARPPRHRDRAPVLHPARAGRGRAAAGKRDVRP
ncbi:MAG: UdgX family uracil-DNA binding protein [Acidobacteriota bacterium]